MSVNKLKLCPFCGGVVDVKSYVLYGKRSVIKGVFECLQCQATVAIRASFTTQDPVEALYAAWNRRVSEND